jgi:hypothetical protein
MEHADLDFKPILERHKRAILEKARKAGLLRGYDVHYLQENLDDFEPFARDVGEWLQTHVGEEG